MVNCLFSTKRENLAKKREFLMTRWTQLKQLLRPWLGVPLSSSNKGRQNVLALLRELSEFQAGRPITRQDALPAEMCIYVTTHSGAERAPPSSPQMRVPIRLWSSVLPWECARGLSRMPHARLLPSVLQAYAASEAQRLGLVLPSSCSPQLTRGGAPPPLTIQSEYPTSNLLSSESNSHASGEDVQNDGEVGMLFLQQSIDAYNATCFWSGAITGPIDTVFIQRVDPYSRIRADLRDAVTRNGKNGGGGDVPQNLKLETMKADGLELVVVDYNKLEPFARHDAVYGTPLMTLYKDLYGQAVCKDSGLTCPAPPQDAARRTEASSKEHSIAAVLETRRFFLRDHASAAVDSHKKRQQHESNNDDALSVVIKVVISEALNEEIEEKQQLLQTMVPALERAVSEILKKCLIAVDTERVVNKKEDNHDQDTDENHPGRRREHSRDPASRDDDGRSIPNERVETSFAGRQSDPNGPSATSAKRRSMYVDSSPGYFERQPLDYEVLVEAYKLNLCAGDIWGLIPRMISDLQEEDTKRGISESDLKRLLEISEDTSLIVPDELANAIRRSAAHRLSHG